VKKSSMTLAVLAAAAIRCATARTPAPPPAAGASPAPHAESAAEVHGIDPADLDRSVAACRDFNAYANGGWLGRNPIPADQSYWGSFSILAEKNRENLRKVLDKASRETASAPGSDERKVGDFWVSCMDETAIEAAGVEPILPEIARIERIATPADLQAEITRLQSYGANAVFRFTSEQDRRNSTEVIANASQGGLGLPERDYYTKTDDESKKLRDAYAAHVAKMFELLGDEPGTAAGNARSVLALETRLAEASMTNVERRDPDKTSNRRDTASLARLTQSFSWPAYFRALGVAPAAVNVSQPKFFEAVDRELLATPLAQWKTYLRWQLVNAAAPQLPQKFVDEDFAFYGRTLEGTPENEARWKRCVTSTDAALGQALGKAYVKVYFPPEA
jgi:putative endopeptidase